jgi:RND family efflux transporter MFP subunit
MKRMQQRDRQPRRISRLPAWSIAFLFGGMLAGCKKHEPPPPPPPPEVTVSKPEAREVTDYFEFPGYSAAVGEVEIRAQVTGYLDQVNFIDGQYVKQGELLYEIDPRPYQTVLDSAQANLARMTALAAQAKADLSRSEKLRPSGAISIEEYDQRVANYAVQKASIQSAEAAVRKAELDLGFTKIASPIDGRVSRTRITKGNLVQSGMTGTGATAVLTTVVTINPIYVYFNVDEHALLQYQDLALKEGKQLHPDHLKDMNFPVEIGLLNEEGYPHRGIIDFADNQIDRNTGTLRVRGVFQNTNEFLTPGLYVRVRIPFGEPHRALLIDDRAIGTDQRLKYLLTAVQDPKTKSYAVKKCLVKVGRFLDGMRVIESGLKPDDLVVVNGLQRAREGAAVRPKTIGVNSAEMQPDRGGNTPDPSGKSAAK